MKIFERKLPGEEADIREIVAGILHAQARSAKAQHRPLARGTHTKGVCVRGWFEVFDLQQTIRDPVLRARLTRGVFARAGVYPATIRFANADTTIAPDSKPDVRAVSFAVSIPPGVLGPDATRRDFSMNSASTFPINDAHAFAVLTRVLEADGAWGKLKALATLSPTELWGLLMVAVRGAKQKRSSAVRPYQRLRYWSNVPFRHGPDEAIKYAATARPRNPARDPEPSQNMLRDELIRHLELDERVSEFDFAIQLLDADRMLHRGRRRDEIYWVENASVEWPEDQAPFHVVGRLVLEHGAWLSDEECQDFYIDVTEHSDADSSPLGSTNRARWHAESASRRARLGAAEADAGAGAPLPAPAASWSARIGKVTVGAVARAAGFLVIGAALAVAFFSLGATRFASSGTGMLPAEQAAIVDYPDQGLGAGVDAPGRQAFYYTPQGAGVKDIRYRWFVNLEMPWGKTHIADPAILTRYGFLVDPATARNPDRLPVGFSKHFESSVNAELLDITCAACHTGQIQVTRNGQTRALRIDGGQANHAFTGSKPGQFVPTLIASMVATATNPFKFDRFARRVLGDQYPRGWWALNGELRSVIGTFGGIYWNEHIRRNLSPTEEGFGRTDALARIGNTVFAENLSPKNYKVGDAPVSFPSLWNIWKFDWVQYNASVSQPMARNLGEAMGVGANYALVDAYGRPLPPSQRFRSTANIENLDSLEHALRKLKPPVWQEHILGPIDRARAEEGRQLFNVHCVGCHGPHLGSPGITARNSPGKVLGGDPEWVLATLCADDIGTDPNAAGNFVKSRVDITRTGLTAADLRRLAWRAEEQWIVRDSTYLQGEIARLRPLRDSALLLEREQELASLRRGTEQRLNEIDPSSLPLGAALSYLGTMVRDNAYDDAHYTKERRAELDGFGTLDRPQVVNAYKARPLAGAWATPPYLHNGSVPTIYDLLSPPADRPKKFQVGSRRYDPVKVGLDTVQGFWTFDTSLPGNHNTGHEFGPGYVGGHEQARRGLIGPLLTHHEKMAIIEHLKVRDDDRDVPAKVHMPKACAEGASGQP
jgi:hypothetical protein